MENHEKTIEELNDILEKTYDAIAGFRKAAENAKDTRLMGYFNEQVLTREQFSHELAAEVRNLGGTPKTSGTLQGNFHRAWMDVKTALSLESDEGVLEACITGEKNCIGEYNDLLEESHLPVSTRSLLNKQKARVEVTLRQLEAKEEAYDQ